MPTRFPLVTVAFFPVDFDGAACVNDMMNRLQNKDQRGVFIAFALLTSSLPHLCKKTNPNPNSGCPTVSGKSSVPYGKQNRGIYLILPTYCPSLAVGSGSFALCALGLEACRACHCLTSSLDSSTCSAVSFAVNCLRASLASGFF